MIAGAIVLTILVILIAIGAAVGLAFIPAYMAKKKGHNFGLFWLFGFFLFIPAIIVAAVIEPAAPQQTYYNAGPQYAPPPPPQGTPPPSPASAEEKLRQLERLKEQGFITEAEYEAKKKEYMGF
jgi:hypothetical protein